MRPLNEVQPRRIALLKPSALGDIVHTLPVLSALRRRFPDAEITWVVNRAYEGLIVGHPDLTDTLAFDRGAVKRGVWSGVASAIRLAGELRRRRFDLVIDLQGLFRTGLMCLATGAARRVGFADAREGSRYTYTDKVRAPGRSSAHAVDRLWSVAKAFGIADEAKRFHLPFRPMDRDWAERELAGLPRPLAVFAVGSRWQTKRWPPSHFATLAQKLQSQSGGTCIFVGTAEDTADSREVMDQLRDPAKDFTGKTTLPRLSAILAASDIMIGNDTGPLHLAAALGLPCIAPYTCTKVALHGPYTSLSGGVETTVPCQGSYLKTCPKMICMPELTPDRLWPKLAEALQTWATRCRSA